MKVKKKKTLQNRICWLLDKDLSKRKLSAAEGNSVKKEKGGQRAFEECRTSHVAQQEDDMLRHPGSRLTWSRLRSSWTTPSCTSRRKRPLSTEPQIGPNRESSMLSMFDLQGGMRQTFDYITREHCREHLSQPLVLVKRERKRISPLPTTALTKSCSYSNVQTKT